ncbi:MAG TPA: caspase family protein [Usitatibacter sp.]|nr:caspase family protein [Usitatibacter sp.]
MRVFMVHGVNTGEDPASGDWQAAWEDAFRASAAAAGHAGAIDFGFARFDAIFERFPLNAATVARGLLLLARGALEPPPEWGTRDLRAADLMGTLRWTAGMVLQWIEEPDLRDALNQAIVKQLGDFEPDIVCAHSLGSLATYDALRRMVASGDTSAIDGKDLVTFGSQIAHPAVQTVFGGRIGPLYAAPNGPGITQWFQLYNPHDRVFTCPLPGGDDRTHTVTASFENGLLSHDGNLYLGNTVMGTVVLPRLIPSSGAPATRSLARAIVRKPTPRKRALLVGINDYPNPDWRLEGCLNDTYLVSALLQESGYPAEGIRLVTDRRATRSAILERLDWLVDGARDGDERFFFYSGHGAQMPIYGPGGEPERIDETLVPADFDWSEAHALRDKEFAAFYAHLPYGMRFTTMMDCCHAGGMTRGAMRVKGLDPPDDVRHRAIRWDPRRQMWVARGIDANLQRLGFATSHRPQSAARFTAARRVYGHKGPFMPLLLYAARRSELASEYDHGSVVQGAFTFSFVKQLRAARKASTFQSLVKSVGAELASLGYAQHPEIEGPAVRRGERAQLGR